MTTNNWVGILYSVKYTLLRDARTPFKEILTSLICINIVKDNFITSETMNRQIKESSLKQKERRAENKRCYKIVKNDPNGNHSQEVLDNCAKHQKFLSQCKNQYKKRKLKAHANSRERQRQLNNGREYSRNYRIKKKERENQSREETRSISSETRLNTNQSTNESLNNENEGNDVGNGSGSVNQNDVNNSAVVSTHENINVNKQTVSSDSISNNNTEETNIILPHSRPLLQDSPTASPRKNSHVARRQLNEENSSDGQELTQFDYRKLDKAEKDMIIRLEQDLFLWNVPKGTRLCNNILEFTLNIVRGNDRLVVKEPSPTKLPEDIKAAFKVMLDVEINSEKEVFSKLIDQIEQISMIEGNKIFGQPYYYSQKGRVLKESFDKSIYTEFLDPLERFTSVTQTKRDNLLESFADDNCLNGYVFEIVLAHYLQHNEFPCVSCQNKTLVWNGGSDYPWMDVVCTSCDSTYEIKSKRDFNTAQALFKGNKIEGGCFRSYFNLANKYQHRKETNHFVIVIGRQAINDDDSGESFCKCIVGPIHDLLPIINPKTFANVQHPKLRSRIITSSYFKIWRIYGASFSGPTSESTWKTVAMTYLNNHPAFE